jgi:hypothetical protein
MISSRNSSDGWRGMGVSARVILAPLLLLGFAGVSHAQGFGADPFRPYNSQYDPFVYPIVPGPTDFGQNQSPYGGLRSANRFEEYMNSIQGGGTGARSGIGTPYYQANRTFDREYNRVYQPNKQADARFDLNQEKVTDLYFQYLREKDAKKRVELFKRYKDARGRAGRELDSPRTLGQRTSSRTTRRESSSTKAAEASKTRDRTLGSPPPALPSGRARSRSGTEDSKTESTVGPAPSPLDDMSEPRAASRSRGTLPSQVLDRATREEQRSRIGPRIRGPRPALSPPPDPLKP